MSDSRPRTSPSIPIALTMGEPGGVSQEISIKAWEYFNKNPSQLAFFLIDDPARYQDFAVPISIIDSPDKAVKYFPDRLPILPIGKTVNATAGKALPETASTVIKSIKLGVKLCLEKQASALVTNPIHKKALIDTGFSFSGHTDYLQSLTRDVSNMDNRQHRGAVMMLAGPQLRTIPVTVHQSLSDAIKTLDTDLIAKICRITAEALRYDFGIKEPRLALAGLNPHAGEGGLFGLEDSQIIAKSVRLLRNEGLTITGPLPADTMFHEEARNRYDVAICMYHDQALIPVKMLDFHNTVNITLGLPIVRTSPDHGSALDIAGKNIANPASLIAAIKMADQLATNRARHFS